MEAGASRFEVRGNGIRKGEPSVVGGWRRRFADGG